MKYHNLFIYLWLILAAISLSSCSYYNRIENYRDNKTDEDEKLILKQVYQSFDEETYLILRGNSDLWHLTNVTLSEDRKTVSASLEVVSEKHYAVFEKIQLKQSKNYTPSEKPYIHQTHLFVLNFDLDEENNTVSFPIDNILKFEIYKEVSGLISKALPAAGIAILYFLVCTCPYVYSESENQLVFEGNLFSGSIYPFLEREDYLPILNQSSLSETVKISVSNEKKEILNINQLSLLSVEHKSGVKVLMDQAGIPHTIIDPIAPIQSTSFNRYEHSEELLQADGLAYDFADPEINPISTLSELELVFDNSTEVENGKLILKLKNDNWGGFMYDEVSSMLGRKFEWFHNKEAKRRPEEMKTLMKKQGVLMSVSMYQDGLWHPIDLIWPTGSKAYREIVIPVDLQNLKDDEIKIKLEGGFKFWDIDQGAIDFSEDLELKVYESFAESKETDIDKKIMKELRYDDEMYMNQLKQGERIDLQFQVQEQKDESTYSYFLKGKGFYTLEKEYENRIRIAELLQFRREGGFSHYSFKRFNEIAESLSLIE